VRNSGISARSHIATSRGGGDDDRWLQRDDARDAPVLHLGAFLAQVGHLAATDDLHPVGVDVVQVADQVRRALRVAHGGFVEAALGMGVAGDPLPAERLAVLFKQPLSADGGGFQFGSGFTRSVDQ
jgi:hypothetical protein